MSRMPARHNIAWLAFALSVLIPCAVGQPALLKGRLEPYGANNNTAQLPLTLSWPLSQVTVTFQDSTTITVVLQNVSYTSPFGFEESLLTQYVAFKSATAVSLDVSVEGGQARLTLSGLPEREQHTATLTKIDETRQGRLLQAFLCSDPSFTRRQAQSLAPVGSLAVLGFELDSGGR